MPVDPRDRAGITVALNDELGISLVGQPQLATTGYETFCWMVTLPDGEAVLRIYPSASRDTAAIREGKVLAYLAHAGFDAPRVIATGDSSTAFGLPFVLMTKVDGGPLSERLSYTARLPARIERLAELVANLHSLPIEGWNIPPPADIVAPAGPEAMKLLADNPALGEAAQWIAGAGIKLTPPERPSIIHGDLAPANVLVGEHDTLTLIDWSSAELGDAHSDLAYLLLQIELAHAPAIEHRDVLLDSYRQLVPLNPDNLAFWDAMHTFRLWCFFTAVQTPGLLRDAPVKPELLDLGKADMADRLQERFRRATAI